MCEAARNKYVGDGYEVEEKDVERLAEEPSDIRNTVMADLQMRDGAFPLVYVGVHLIEED